jgi:hypothetical protein
MNDVEKSQWYYLLCGIEKNGMNSVGQMSQNMIENLERQTFSLQDALTEIVKKV